MAKIVHKTTTEGSTVKFGDLGVGEVFKYPSDTEGNALLIKLQPSPFGPRQRRDPYRTHLWIGGDAFISPAHLYNAVYLVGGYSAGEQVHLGSDKKVVPAKSCKLETEF